MSRSQLIMLIVVALGLQQCSTELEVRAPYKEFTTIYGLLDKTETVHLVKINKSFLGEGSALDMAQVPDSSEYHNDDLQAFIEKIENGNVTQTFSLNDTMVDVREPGTFYYPIQKMYTFTSPLDENSEYRIRCEIADRTVTATTNLVKDVPVNNADASSTVKVAFKTSSGYANYEFNWSQARNGKRYICYYQFNYREVHVDGSITDHSIRRKMGTQIAKDSQATLPEGLFAVVNGQTFYDDIGNTVADDPDVTKRYIGDMAFIIEVANDDFSTYIQLNEPVTGIVEDRPPFSNVENGLGLFASRTVKVIFPKTLSPESMLELKQGQYTVGLKFCLQTASPGDPLGCP